MINGLKHYMNSFEDIGEYEELDRIVKLEKRLILGYDVEDTKELLDHETKDLCTKKLLELEVELQRKDIYRKKCIC